MAAHFYREVVGLIPQSEADDVMVESDVSIPMKNWLTTAFDTGGEVDGE
jgi:hypothetical protein